jgi:hypothetical protein
MFEEIKKRQMKNSESWYVAKVGFFPAIVPVEIERHSGASIWLVGGKRRARISDWQSYFKTWEEAKNHLLETQQAEVDNAQKRLDHQLKRLERVKRIKKV